MRFFAFSGRAATGELRTSILLISCQSPRNCDQSTFASPDIQSAAGLALPSRGLVIVTGRRSNRAARVILAKLRRGIPQLVIGKRGDRFSKSGFKTANIGGNINRAAGEQLTPSLAPGLLFREY